MSQNRREFLKVSLATGGVVALGAGVPGFLSRTAAAAEKGAKDTVLVVVELTGGNDGLNTVVPFKDETYGKLRPTIAGPKGQGKGVGGGPGVPPPRGGGR